MKFITTKSFILLLVGAVLFCSPPAAAATVEYDVCVYGGTSAGVIAAYSAAKYGKKVVLIEPGHHLGGMSSGGLGYTDIGNKYVVTGLARDFYRRIGQHYGKFEQWIFEPKVAEALFQDYVRRGGFKVLFNHRLKAVSKDVNVIKVLNVETTEAGAALPDLGIKAKIFIDCSYEGDLMAAAGVSYTVGREPNSQYNETYNGVQLMDGHQIPDGVDPYVTPGRPESGLLWGIRPGALQPEGTGDHKVQAYNFRICLTDKPENRIPITKPANYDPAKYQLLLRLMVRKPWKSLNDGFIISRMPNGKTDINNRGGFSTDMIGENWKYPEAGHAERKKIIKAHVDYSKGLLYFIGNDPAVPRHLRNEMKQWGYPKDEYTDNGHWSPQLYVREARRMVGELVMTQHHCEGKEVVPDGVGMAAYTMDSHNCDRLVVSGFAKNEGNVEIGGFGPYPVSYRSIVPKEREAANLFVPVCLSASHIAYGSIRMEPVFMVLAQVAAVAGCEAIDKGTSVQKVEVAQVNRLLKENPLCDGSVPEILIDNQNAGLVSMSGTWNKHTYGGYGPDFLVSEQKQGEETFVEFKTTVVSKGTYSVYAYVPKLPDIAAEILVVLFDGKSRRNLSIHTAELEVQGQTSGEWTKLGDFKLDNNNKVSVKIIAGSAMTVADAVLLVPETD